jgi:hypothetical protein
MIILRPRKEEVAEGLEVMRHKCTLRQILPALSNQRG